MQTLQHERNAPYPHPPFNTSPPHSLPPQYVFFSIYLQSCAIDINHQLNDLGTTEVDRKSKYGNNIDTLYLIYDCSWLQTG